MKNIGILSIVREALLGKENGGIVITGMIIIIVVLIIYTFKKNVANKWWLMRHLFILLKKIDVTLYFKFDIILLENNKGWLCEV